MEIGICDLADSALRVIDAVGSGERVTLILNGEPVADIVFHERRSHWLSGDHLRDQLRDRAADPAMGGDLDEIFGHQTTIERHD